MRFRSIGFRMRKVHQSTDTMSNFAMHHHYHYHNNPLDFCNLGVGVRVRMKYPYWISFTTAYQRSHQQHRYSHTYPLFDIVQHVFLSLRPLPRSPSTYTYCYQLHLSKMIVLSAWIFKRFIFLLSTVFVLSMIYIIGLRQVTLSRNG